MQALRVLRKCKAALAAALTPLTPSSAVRPDGEVRGEGGGKEGEREQREREGRREGGDAQEDEKEGKIEWGAAGNEVMLGEKAEWWAGGCLWGMGLGVAAVRRGFEREMEACVGKAERVVREAGHEEHVQVKKEKYATE